MMKKKFKIQILGSSCFPAFPKNPCSSHTTMILRCFYVFQFQIIVCLVAEKLRKNAKQFTEYFVSVVCITASFFSLLGSFIMVSTVFLPCLRN